jgi:hypothetical protein
MQGEIMSGKAASGTKTSVETPKSRPSLAEDTLTDTSASGQTGHIPRVEIDGLVEREHQPLRPITLPEVEEPGSTTGHITPVKNSLFGESEDRAKQQDDSVTGSRHDLKPAPQS